MTTVGQIEKKTQSRVAAWFQNRQGYAYLCNWKAGRSRPRHGKSGKCVTQSLLRIG
jgi:hypothetical protein